jgi:thiosulfate/3-mercaptopyruvate sulfurtransferase
MAENGYAKPVLVTTDWLAEHLNDDGVVVAEVDENPDLYDEGHIAGAVKLHWRDDLQDPVERDLVDKPTFERLLGERGIANDTTLVLYGDKNNWFAAYAYWYLKIYGHGDVRILDGGRQKWADEAREFTTETPQPQQADYRANERDESIRTYRDSVRAQIGEPSKALVDVRSPQEYAGDLIAPPGYEQEGAQRAGPHPDRGVDSLGDGRARRRDLQERRRAPRALRGQRRHAGKRGDGVLPDRRAKRSHLVRPPRAAGLRNG